MTDVFAYHQNTLFYSVPRTFSLLWIYSNYHVFLIDNSVYLYYIERNFIMCDKRITIINVLLFLLLFICQSVSMGNLFHYIFLADALLFSAFTPAHHCCPHIAVICTMH